MNARVGDVAALRTRACIALARGVAILWTAGARFLAGGPVGPVRVGEFAPWG